MWRHKIKEGQEPIIYYYCQGAITPNGKKPFLSTSLEDLDLMDRNGFGDELCEVWVTPVLYVWDSGFSRMFLLFVSISKNQLYERGYRTWVGEYWIGWQRSSKIFYPECSLKVDTHNMLGSQTFIGIINSLFGLRLTRMIPGSNLPHTLLLLLMKNHMGHRAKMNYCYMQKRTCVNPTVSVHTAGNNCTIQFIAGSKPIELI